MTETRTARLVIVGGAVVTTLISLFTPFVPVTTTEIVFERERLTDLGDYGISTIERFVDPATGRPFAREPGTPPPLEPVTCTTGYWTLEVRTNLSAVAGERTYWVTHVVEDFMEGEIYRKTVSHFIGLGQTVDFVTRHSINCEGNGFSLGTLTIIEIGPRKPKTITTTTNKSIVEILTGA